MIQHYISLAESINDEFLNMSGTLLNRARDDRMRADYFVGVDREGKFGLRGASREEAVEAAEIAARFLRAWTERWTDVDPPRIVRSAPPGR